MKSVDWTKEPEIRWERRICPICHEPMGENSQCFNIDSPREIVNGEDDSIGAKTIEINGELFPIFAKQCYFRKTNEYFVVMNYPISAPLSTLIASIEGVEMFIVKSAYKCSIIIADQFDEAVVKSAVNKKYREFINGFRKEKN
jgi:hypothetical protein